MDRCDMERSPLSRRPVCWHEILSDLPLTAPLQSGQAARNSARWKMFLSLELYEQRQELLRQGLTNRLCESMAQSRLSRSFSRSIHFNAPDARSCNGSKTQNFMARHLFS
jgi:hypothetical protein